MSEQGAKTTLDFQRRLQASPEDTEQSFALAYRAMVLDALEQLPRRAFPRDLGALGIMIEAAELFATAHYFSRGTTMPKGFVEKGLDELKEWLERCRALFKRYGDLFDQLVPPKPVAGDPKRVAAAFWGTTNYILRQIGNHRDTEEEEAEIAPGESGDDGAQRKVITLLGSTIEEIAKALGTIMCCWFDAVFVNQLIGAINAGAEALCECRSLTNTVAQGLERGTA